VAAADVLDSQQEPAGPRAARRSRSSSSIRA